MYSCCGAAFGWDGVKKSEGCGIKSGCAGNHFCIELVADWYRTGIELVLYDLPIRPQARLRCLSLAAVHRMPKYGIQVPAALKHLRFVCGRSYRNEIERQDGEEMVADLKVLLFIYGRLCRSKIEWQDG